MDIRNINVKDITQVAEYVNSELQKDRLQKDIEVEDFNVNPGVIKNRLMRKGYKKIDNQWVCNNTTIQTTDIIQNKSIEQQPKKAFNNNEVEKLGQLLKIDIDTLNQMINEYTTRQNTKCSIEIKDDTTTVTSIRVNKEIYTLAKEKAKTEGLGVSEMLNKCMLGYLNKPIE